MSTQAPVAPAPATTPAPVAPKVDAAVPAKPADVKPAEAQKADAKVAADVKKYKLVIDGAEEEVDEPELIRRAQKAKGAEKRFEEANRVKAQLNAILTELKDPKKVFQLLSRPEIGHDIKTIASEWLYENVVKPESMPKEQWELQKAREELAQIKRERDELFNKDKEARETAEMQAEMERLDKSVKNALEGSNVPKTPWTVRRMAYYMQLGLQRGIQLDPKEVVPFVKNDHAEAVRQMAESLDGDDLEKFLGETVAEKIRKHTLSKLQTVKQKSDPVITRGQDKKPVYLNEKEWSKEMDRKMGLA